VIVGYINGSPSQANLSPAAAYLCALGMFVAAEVQSVALGQYFFRGFRLGLRMKAAIGQVVYEKALRMTPEERSSVGVGPIVSFMQIDAAKVADAVPYLHALWSSILQLSIAIYMLDAVLGPAAFAGLAVMVAMLPLNVWVGKYQATFTRRIMRARDARVSYVAEVLQGVKLLKLFAWEPPTLAEVARKRNIELSALMRGALFGTVSTFLWGAAPILVTVATFSLYGAISTEPFTAQKAFTSLTLFGIMRFPLNSLPNQVRFVLCMGWVVHMAYAHGNNSLWCTAVEPHSLITVLWHCLSSSSFDCL